MIGIFGGFIIASLGASIVILLLLLLKRGLKHHLSPCWQYRIDLLMILVLLIPLLPNNLSPFGDLGHWLHPDSPSLLAQSEGSSEQLLNNVTAGGIDWMQDVSVSITQWVPDPYIAVLAALWLLGLAACGTRLFFGSQQLRLVKTSVKLTEEPSLQQLFLQAKTELKIATTVSLGLSIMVDSPMVVGVRQPLIILPHDTTTQFQAQEIHHILLHELAHCKRQDIFFNHLLCLLQMIYWFNPLVYLAFNNIRLDREMACDFAVLTCLPKENNLAYGMTMINFVGRLSRRQPLSLAMEMGGTKQQLTQRIKQIASYQAESKEQRRKSRLIFFITLMLVFSQVPAVSALTGTMKQDKAYEFSASHIQYEDLSSYFGDDEGCFVLYDLTDDQYTIYNQTASTERVLAASTYKVYSGLIALEEEVITPDHSALPWDGTTYSYDMWNRDHDLDSAMKNSVNWYFQHLDRQVGKETLVDWFAKLAYGNQDLSGGLDDGWIASSLKISPVEQVELLTALYKNETVFHADSVDVIKNTLRLSEKNDAALSGKTGSVTLNGKTVSGWLIGYVENRGRTSIFALHLQGQDNAGGNTAAKIALSILADKGIY